MDFIAIAKRWIATVLAATLGVTVDVIQAILPSQPRWLAQIRTLALQLSAAAQRGDVTEQGVGAGGEAPTGREGPGAAARGTDLAALLESHTILQQSLLDFEARGLGLDPILMERMAKDWSPASIVSYLQSCEQQIRQRSTEALAVASAPFCGRPLAGPEVPAGGTPARASPQTKSTRRGKASPAGKRRGKRSRATPSSAD